MDELRQAVGPWIIVPVVWGFQSTDAAGALGLTGVDTATIAEDTFIAPWPGFLAAIGSVTTGGNHDGAHYQLEVGGTPNTDSDWAPGANAADYHVYLPQVIEFAAGDALTLQLDAVTTGRDTIVTVYLCMNVGA